MASQVSICESQLGTRCEHLRDFPMAALCMVLLSATMAATAGTVCEWLFKETYSTSIHLQNAQVRRCLLRWLPVAARGAPLFLTQCPPHAGRDGCRGEGGHVVCLNADVPQLTSFVGVSLSEGLGWYITLGSG
jgi:hypothetical protein